MHCRRILSVAAAIALVSVFAGPTAAQLSIPSYYSDLSLNIVSPSALATPVGGFANPSVYGMMGGFSGQFSWSTPGDVNFGTVNDWGAFASAGPVGIGVIETQVILADGSMGRVTDTRIALADRRTRSTSFGVAYGFSSGDDEALNRTDVLQAGMSHRVGRLLKFGLSGAFSLDNKDTIGLADLAIRPTGRWLTLFADGELPRGISAKDAPWSAGALVRVFDGLEFSGRYFSDANYSLSVGFEFYGFNLTGSPRYNTDQQHTNTVYEVRF